MTDHTAYLDDLVSELRLLEVPGERIGQIIAEAESHLAESGEAPEEAFGSPAEYAALLTERKETFTARDLLFIVGTFLVTAVAAYLLYDGVVGLFDHDTLWGLPPVLLIVVGALGLGAWLGSVWKLRDPVVDPRSGKEIRWDGKGRRRS